MTRFVYLASQSPRRRQLLDQLGVAHRLLLPEDHEDAEALEARHVVRAEARAHQGDLIALLRPTKSVGLYVQMVGRGTRLAEGKDDCLVLDFAGNTARHGPIDMVDGRKKEPAGDGDAPIKVCPECQTINHASARRCIDCDHGFPPPAPAFVGAWPARERR